MAPTLESIRNVVKNYNPSRRLNSDLKAVLETTIAQNLQPKNIECIQNLRDHLHADFMYSPELVRAPTIIFGMLRGRLELKGLPYLQKFNSHRIDYGLIETFLTDDQDK